MPVPILQMGCLGLREELGLVPGHTVVEAELGPDPSTLGSLYCGPLVPL